MISLEQNHKKTMKFLEEKESFEKTLNEYKMKIEDLEKKNVCLKSEH